MESATSCLSLVFEPSDTLKMILWLQCEARKALRGGSGLAPDNRNLVNPGDLTRAAASVAAIEELLAQPLLTPFADRKGGAIINMVENMRPKAKAMASFVHRAAAGLMDKLQKTPLPGHAAAYPPHAAPSIAGIGGMLQVYFHLGDLPGASWGAALFALAYTERAAL